MEPTFFSPPHSCFTRRRTQYCRCGSYIISCTADQVVALRLIAEVWDWVMYVAPDLRHVQRIIGLDFKSLLKINTGIPVHPALQDG